MCAFTVYIFVCLYPVEYICASKSFQLFYLVKNLEPLLLITTSFFDFWLMHILFSFFLVYLLITTLLIFIKQIYVFYNDFFDVVCALLFFTILRNFNHKLANLLNSCNKRFLQVFKH